MLAPTMTGAALPPTGLVAQPAASAKGTPAGLCPAGTGDCCSIACWRSSLGLACGSWWGSVRTGSRSMFCEGERAGAEASAAEDTSVAAGVVAEAPGSTAARGRQTVCSTAAGTGSRGVVSVGLPEGLPPSRSLPPTRLGPGLGPDLSCSRQLDGASSQPGHAAAAAGAVAATGTVLHTAEHSAGNAAQVANEPEAMVGSRVLDLAATGSTWGASGSTQEVGPGLPGDGCSSGVRSASAWDSGSSGGGVSWHGGRF